MYVGFQLKPEKGYFDISVHASNSDMVSMYIWPSTYIVIFEHSFVHFTFNISHVISIDWYFMLSYSIQFCQTKWKNMNIRSDSLRYFIRLLHITLLSALILTYKSLQFSSVPSIHNFVFLFFFWAMFLILFFFFFIQFFSCLF